MKSIIDIRKLLYFGISFICITIIAITSASLGYIAETIVFFAISVIFMWLVIKYGSVIYVTKDNIILRFLGIKYYRIDWSDIAEVGIIGEDVFKKGIGPKRGNIYIYLSTRTHSQEELFKVAQMWPPKNMIFFLYNSDKLERIQYFWGRNLNLFNVDELDIS